MAQQNIVDTIKQNWKQFEEKVEGKKEEPPKKDYFAHDWTPPKGKRTGSHFTPPKWDTPKQATRKKTARKK